MKKCSEHDHDGTFINELTPEGWIYSKIKYISKINKCVLPENSDPDLQINYIDIGSVIGEGNIGDVESYSFDKAPSRARRVVSYGDTIVSTVRTYLKAIATISNAHDGFICSTGFAVVTPDNMKVSEKFLGYIFRSNLCIDQTIKYSTGVSYPSITSVEVGNIRVNIPPLDIQKNIADFLEKKTSKIDELIIDKQNLITLLKEKRQILISETVTKGLDKAAPMKESGVDWIGKVPKHWDVKRLKWLFEIVKRLYFKEDRQVLSITQKGLKIKDIDSNDGQHAQSYAGYQMVNVNDFAMNSMDLLTGFVDCSPFEGVTSPDYRVFRFWRNNIQNHNYYKYIFQMCYTNKIFYGLGQGVSNLGRWRLQTDVFLNFLLPQPPLEEQTAIAEYLDCKTMQIDNLVVNISEQIEKLKEYRQCIIDEVVTGKVVHLSEGGV